VFDKLPRFSKGCRRRMLRHAETCGDPALALRCRIVVHLSLKHSQPSIAKALLCAPSTVSRTRRAFLREGEAGLRDRRSENGVCKADLAFDFCLVDVLSGSPQDFGWERPTWTRELLALELARRGQPQVSVSTMGRALARIDAKLKRPKPVVCCPWPSRRRNKVLRELKRLAERCDPDEPVFYGDEVDLHLNPKIGPDWTLPGQRRVVVTPGKNVKRYAAGALHATTRRLVFVTGEKKTSALFCQLLWKLVSTYRRARRIHLILDNFIIHTSKITQRCIDQFGDKVVLHFLPPYCPDENRIERVWLDLHANVTRNHRCKSMDELMQRIVAFLNDYSDQDELKPSLRPAIPIAA